MFCISNVGFPTYHKSINLISPWTKLITFPFAIGEKRGRGLNTYGIHVVSEKEVCEREVTV